MTEKYNREEFLQNQLNAFLENSLSLPQNDYYSNLDLNGFLHLKSILNSINNIFTLKVSLSFAHWVTQKLNLNEQTTHDIISQIMNTKPNANGFDIEVSKPVKLIAEVKCNIPINGGLVYGSAQKSGINKDITALLNGKIKSSILPNNHFKFMVFLNKLEIKKATEHFVSNMKKDKEKIIFVNKNTKINSTENVYIVYVSI